MSCTNRGMRESKSIGSTVHLGVYIIVYFAISLSVVVCIVELHYAADERNKLKHKNVHPQLEVWPIANATSGILLLRYDENDVVSVDRWINILDRLLEAYRTHPDPSNVAAKCDLRHPPSKGKICPVDLDDFGPCVPPFYGYYSFSPCIFIRLTNAHDWIPDFYTGMDALPSSMTKDLATEVKSDNIKHQNKQLWLSCYGENDIDNENIEAFNYYPSRGFPSYFFPLKRTSSEYLTPLVAVEIVNPKASFLINIECRVWAKNLERRGHVRFSIMRDEAKYQEDEERFL